MHKPSNQIFLKCLKCGELRISELHKSNKILKMHHKKQKETDEISFVYLDNSLTEKNK